MGPIIAMKAATAQKEMSFATARKWMKAPTAKKAMKAAKATGAMKRGNLKAIDSTATDKHTHSLAKVVVQSMLSGEALGGDGHYFEMSWDSTGIDVRNLVSAHLKKTASADVLAQAELHDLLIGNQVFAKDVTLASLGCTDCVVLQAVISAKPILHLFEPCSAWSLSSKHFNWGSSGDGCSDESDVEDDEDEECQGMSAARPEARAVADQMQSALGNEFLYLTETERRCALECVRDMDWKKGAEVIVISNPGNKKADTICRALWLERVMRWFMGDCGEPFVKAMDFSNILIGERCFDEGSDSGTTKNESEDVSDDESEDQKRVKAITSIIANQLSDHFMFTLENTNVCAPVVYGGVASDGSIVGVLASTGGYR